LNRRLVLRRRPKAGAAIDDADFALETAPLPEPGEGELLVRVCWLGFDPAQRGWLDDAPSYLPPVEIGAVIRASAVGQVVASRNPAFPAGALVSGMFGWQEHALSDGTGLVRRVPDDVPPTAALGVLGTPGLAAYFGMLSVGQPQAGDVVLISAAAGATGSVAGQLAKLAGARTIGIAGGPEKCRWVTEVAGFDAVIDYKREDVATRIGALAPDGLDIYYDNVGGAILDAALGHLAVGARVVLCGAISTRFAVGVEPPGIKNLPALIIKRARMEGVVIVDYQDRFDEARTQLADWLRAGKLLTADDVQHGDLEQAPGTLRRLFEGRNLGKQLLQIAAPS